MTVANQIGRVLAGKYRLEHTLGTGGMGTVIAATHLGLGRKVALKFMRQGVLADDAAIGRFEREARAVATLRSEHVVQVMDVGVDGENGAPYIVMEYLEGRDLASMLESSGVPPVADVVGYVLQACEGLAEAHAHGIVHRDLKPANLFLTRRPDGTPLVKVLDFGVSKLTESTTSGSFRLTHPRETVGSPAYMSPEQIVAAPEVDARADIWALGVILYELFTGKPPFAGAHFLELGLDITNRAHPQLSRLVPRLAPGLVTVVDRCLQKLPASRFRDLAALAAALMPHGGPGAELAAKRIALTLGVPVPTTAGQLIPPPGRARSPAVDRSVAIGPLAAIGAIALLGGAIAAGVMWQRRPVERPTVSATPTPAAVPRAPAAPPPRAIEETIAQSATKTATSSASAASVAITEPLPAKLRAAHKPRRVPDAASPIVAPPPSERPTVDGSGATRTRRGPVITDL